MPQEDRACERGVPNFNVIRPLGYAGKARDYSGMPGRGKPARGSSLFAYRATAAMAWAQAQPLAQAHWKL